MPNFKALAVIVTAAGVRQGQPDSQPQTNNSPITEDSIYHISSYIMTLHVKMVSNFEILRQITSTKVMCVTV